MKILYVEDDENYADLIKAIVTDSDPSDKTSVITAGSVAEAKRVLEREKDKPDVLLLDLGLPDSRGLDTVRALVNGIPAVVFTGTMDPDTIHECAARGVRDYLIKSKTTSGDLMRSLFKAYDAGQRLRRLSEAIDSVASAVDALAERAARV